MVLTPEQSNIIKKQLIKQIDSSQLENKEQITDYIKNLNPEQLEEFLRQNKIKIQSSQPQQSPEATQCIFCSIINNKTPSYKIDENKKSIAILELNPLSKGHVLIVPNEHTTIDKLSKTSLTLSQKLAKKLKIKLKPEDVKIETSSLQEHAIINVIPFYKDEKIEKKKASEEQLQALQSLLQTKKRQKRAETNLKVKITKKSLKGLPKISFRIP